MKKLKDLNLYFSVLIFLLWNCSDNRIIVDLSNSEISVDTLSIDSISAYNYSIPPKIGSNEKLYLGTRSGLSIPYSLIKIDSIGQFSSSTGIKWEAFLDSSITLERIDSIFFKLYSKDSFLVDSTLPNLYYSTYFTFSEDSSTYLDINFDFNSNEWISLGVPNIKVSNDSSGNYLNTELIWNINDFSSILIFDSNDSLIRKYRTFAISFINNDHFIELMSRESSTGSTDPKIKIYYRQNIILEEDSTFSDTSLSATFYAKEDLSIINPENFVLDTSSIILNSGAGIQSIINIPFSISTLPNKSIIRNAILKLPIDSVMTDSGEQIIFSPLSKQLNINDNDPYLGLGSPYKISSKTDGGSILKFSLKAFFQDINYGKQINMGFKINSSISNNPFSSIYFNFNDIKNKPKIEITYVKM